MVYQGDETIHKIKSEPIRRCSEGLLTVEEAREEWELVALENCRRKSLTCSDTDPYGARVLFSECSAGAYQDHMQACLKKSDLT